MGSFWHSEVLGMYSNEEQWVGLDYKKLFLDPELAKQTYIHELTHSLLSKSTEYGQATTILFQALPKINNFSDDDKNKIKKSLMESQLFVQEGTATLMETLQHAKSVGKSSALQWAKEHLRDDYYERLNKLAFVFDMGLRYREEFTKKVPHFAMHTDIRKALVEQDLLSSSEKLINYLENPVNKPDDRFNEMIKQIRLRTFIATKTVDIIAKESGITFYPDTSKETVANFLNYVNPKAGGKRVFTVDDIHDPLNGKDAILNAGEETILANMNMNLSDTGIFIWELDGFLSYKSQFCAILVSKIDDDLQVAKDLEKLTNQKYDFGILGFTNTYEKYVTSTSLMKTVELTNTDFKGTTLIVKWVLYEPGQDNILFLPRSRKPDVVIYNTAHQLQTKFNDYFKAQQHADYILMGASEDHPFQTIILRDSKRTLHLVNVFGNKPAHDFFENNKLFLNKIKPEALEPESFHLNNSLSAWMGLDWEIDWFHTMLDGENLILRH